MYSLFFTWHGWIAFVILLPSGGVIIYQLRHTLDKWMKGFGLAGLIFLSAIAGHLASCYEGVVIQSGTMTQVSRGSQVTRISAFRWRVPDRSEHTVRATREMINHVSPGQTIRKLFGRWFPEAQR